VKLGGGQVPAHGEDERGENDEKKVPLFHVAATSDLDHTQLDDDQALPRCASTPLPVENAQVATLTDISPTGEIVPPASPPTARAIVLL
jgi:hypothetical protein